MNLIEKLDSELGKAKKCTHIHGCKQNSVRTVLMPSMYMGWRQESFCEEHAVVAEEMRDRLGVKLQ